MNQRFLCCILFIFCFSTWSQGTSALSCHDLFLKVRFGISSRAVVDIAKLQQWVDAQPLRFKPLASMLARRYTVVSQKEFLSIAIETTRRMLQKHHTKNLVFVYSNLFERPTEYRSGPWVIGMLQEHLPELRKVPTISVETGDFRRTRCFSRPCTYVYIDDAAYSGRQAQSGLSILSTKIHAHQGGRAKVIGLIPFTTEGGLKRLSEVSFPPKSGLFRKAKPITIFWGSRMPTVKELASQEGLTIPSPFETKADSTTVTLLEFKIGDVNSVFPFFRGGHIPVEGMLDKRQISSAIPFIEYFEPPYRIPFQDSQ